MGFQKLRWKKVRIHRTIGLTLTLAAWGCASVPEPQFKKYDFPQGEAFVSKPNRRYERVGTVRAKVNLPSLDQKREFDKLCANYFNSAVQKMVEYAKNNGADAVIDVRSIVFLMDGKREEYPKAECSDDGEEGQVLTQGVSVHWSP